MSNTEWGFLIGALALMDLIQAALDLFAIGVVVNRFIDVIVGLSLIVILWIKGIRGARIYGSIAAAFGLEFIPLVDVLPLWTLDGLYAFSQDKIANRSGGLGKVSTALAKKAIVKGRASGQFPARPQQQFKDRFSRNTDSQ